jgi:hypothetical protein
MGLFFTFIAGDGGRLVTPARVHWCGTSSMRLRCTGMTEDLSFRRKPLTPEQRQARDASRRIEAEKAMRDHEAAQKALYANRERLRAERLAREAAADKG